MAHKYGLLTISILFVCLVPSIAPAASFDCGKARTPFEKTVCADPKLSAQDMAMAQRYNTALPLLSAPGQAILRTGQKQWLKTVQVLCLDNKRKEGSTACLQRQYADRLSDLRSAAVSMGPFVFSRDDHYASMGKQALTGIPLEQHTGLPRIDHPLSPLAEQWNAAMVQWAADARTSWCFGDAETSAEQFVNFTVESATSDFINVKMRHYEQCGGGAGSEDTHNLSYWLKPGLPRLKAADLFKPDSGWEAFLSKRATQALGTDDAIVFNDGINKGISDPAAWSFTKPGLLISFNPGEAGAMASGILEVTLSWSDLHPFLSPNAPIPR
ncbi:lysozyme inhibitor LprI family protein [Paralcaligenes ureilyticus]|uniref:Uncharacterized protein DUF3298 n=1 Tax=Paralcaligenes ureilyticus TaxID=627131 RepID=A0A4R3M162_9BURK|nr:DUF3298 domain-containing protein [Paralcaligenes ureilyticus]TCT06376.1 uncharacterized protein DUF3298 [Paralcaligenes ureilyticus]